MNLLNFDSTPHCDQNIFVLKKFSTWLDACGRLTGRPPQIVQLAYLTFQFRISRGRLMTEITEITHVKLWMNSVSDHHPLQNNLHIVPAALWHFEN